MERNGCKDGREARPKWVYRWTVVNRNMIFFFKSSVMLHFSLRILCNYVYSLYEHMFIFMKYFYNWSEGHTNTCVLFYKLTASCMLPDFALALYTQLWFSWKYIGREYERIETTVTSYFIEPIIIWRAVIRLQRDLNGSDVIMDHISFSAGIWRLLSLSASHSGEEITVGSQGDARPSTKRSKGKTFVFGATVMHAKEVCWFLM